MRRRTVVVFAQCIVPPPVYEYPFLAARHGSDAAVHTNRLVFPECADIAHEAADFSVGSQRRAGALLSDAAQEAAAGAARMRLAFRAV